MSKKDFDGILLAGKVLFYYIILRMFEQYIVKIDMKVAC